MRIGIDAAALKRDPFRGINLSARHMIEAILRNDRKNTFIFFNTKCTGDFFGRLKARYNNIRIGLVPGDITPKSSSGLDVYHILNFFDMKKKQAFPSELKCRTIATVYDLIPVIFWDNYLMDKPKRFRDDYALRLGELENFARIMVPSLSTKKDLIELLDIKKGSIDIIKLGITSDPDLRISRQFCDKLMKKYNITKDYIICTAGMDDRKNIPGLVESYIMLDEKIKEKYQMVVVCRINCLYRENIFRLYGSRLKNGQIIFTDFVPERELAALYRNASLSVFPSFYEGFGLPVLEAMSHGCPVITSNISSMPEVGGNAALLIDPYKPSSIAMAMEKVLSSRKLADDMRKKSLQQAKKFSWDICAGQLSGMYKKTHGSDFGLCSRRGERPRRSRIKLGIVSVWNTKDGVASYTSSLIKSLPKDIEIAIFAKESDKKIAEDGENVIRCWEWEDNLKRLYASIMSEEPDIVHFQFNFDYFRFNILLDTIKKLKKLRIKSIVTFHSTDDSGHGIKLNEITEDLKSIDRILVHTKKDFDRLSALGLDNAEMLGHGVKKSRDRKKKDARKGLFSNSAAISTFGYPFPHKATVELIKALAIVKRKYKDAILLDLCSLNPDSTNIGIIKNYNRLCRKTAKKLGISKDMLFFTEHLAEPEVAELLQASDIVALPYKPIKDSTSSAVRYAIASHRPVITTDTPIFSEFDGEVHKIKDHSPKEIAKGIISLLEDKKLCEGLVRNADSYAKENSWEKITKKYESVLRSLAQETG